MQKTFQLTLLVHATVVRTGNSSAQGDHYYLTSLRKTQIRSPTITFGDDEIKQKNSSAQGDHYYLTSFRKTQISSPTKAFGDDETKKKVLLRKLTMAIYYSLGFPEFCG